MKFRKSLLLTLLVSMSLTLGACADKTESTVENEVAAVEETVEITAEVIDKALQGVWKYSNGATLTFVDNELTILSDGSALSGTYEIDMENAQILAALKASDGTVNIKIPFEYESDALVIYNNQGEALIKQ